MADPASVTVPNVLPVVAEMEKLNTEQVRLSRDVDALQTELRETLAENDQYLADLNDKNELLIQREEKLKIMKEKNTAEVDMLKLELQCMEEKFAYEVDIREKHGQVLEDQRTRYIKLCEENEMLEQTFADMNQELSNMEVQHALTIHEMNKDMSVVRQNLELQLRRELTAMDNKYQERAFASLSEHFKTDIFENSKLKDEVTLQSIGLANLSLRLGKQKHDTNHHLQEIKGLNRKAFALRTALAELALNRRNEKEAQNAHLDDIQQLEIKTTQLMDQVHSPPEYFTLENEISKCKTSIDQERSKIVMWHERLQKLYALDDRLVPTSAKEIKGLYSTQLWAFGGTNTDAIGGNKSKNNSSVDLHATALAQMKKENIGMGLPEVESAVALNTSTSIAVTTETGGNSVRISDIEAMCSHDSILASALLGLKGKESTLVAGRGGEEKPGDKKKAADEQQNMVAWIVTEILSIWRSTQSTSLLKSVSMSQSQIENSNSQFRQSELGIQFAIDEEGSVERSRAGNDNGNEQEQYEYSDQAYDPFAPSPERGGGRPHEGMLDGGDINITAIDRVERNDDVASWEQKEEGFGEDGGGSMAELENADDEDPYLALKRETEVPGTGPPSPVPVTASISRIDADADALESAEQAEDLAAFLQGVQSHAKDKDKDNHNEDNGQDQEVSQSEADLVNSYRSVSSAVATYDDDEDYFYNEDQRYDENLAVDLLVDELLAEESGSKDNDNQPAPWYRFREEARRLPANISIGRPGINEQFHYDAIRPAKVSYDLDPPMTAKIHAKMKGKHNSLSTSALRTIAGDVSKGGGVKNISSVHASKMSISKASTTSLARAVKSQPDFVQTNPKMMRSGSGYTMVLGTKKASRSSNVPKGML